MTLTLKVKLRYQTQTDAKSYVKVNVSAVTSVTLVTLTQLLPNPANSSSCISGFRIYMKCISVLYATK